MKPTQNCFTIERDTHKGTTQRFFLFFFCFFFFVAKIRRKVPHENIHGEATVLENFQKKNQIATFPGGKFFFFKSSHLRRKKIGFEIVEICGRFGQIPSFLLLKRVYEGCANPNRLTPKEDDRTNRHLKYYI
jgi:hypothetical protein